MDKPRYDGQVRKVTEVTQENQRLQAEIARLSGQQQPNTPAPATDDGPLSTEDMVKIMFQDFAERHTNTLLDGILDKYPEAKPFRDFVLGSTPQEIEASAKSLHERALVLKGVDPNAAPPPAEGGAEGQPPAEGSPQQPQGAATTTTVVPGGSPPAQGGEASPEDQLRQALADRNMAEYTRLKRANPDVKIRR